MKNTYICFLNTMALMERENPGRDLDDVAIRLLEYALRSSDKGEILLVGDFLKLNQIGSQATLHSRVKQLVALGYLRLITDKEDGRKKSVVPTKNAFKYLQFMSECISDAVSS